jgi:hypothetical protein
LEANCLLTCKRILILIKKKKKKAKLNDFFSLVSFSLLISLLFSLQAIFLQQKGNLMELVDPELGSEFSEEEALRMIKVALLCANASPALRPTMTAAVSMLEGLKVVHELTMDSSIYGNEWRFEGLRDQFGPSPQPSSSESHSLIQSSNAT